MRVRIMLREALLWVKNTINIRLRSSIRYDIVGFSDRNYRVMLQCRVERACFPRDIMSAISDSVLISQMLPEQACFLGLLAGEGLARGELSYVREYECPQNHLAAPRNDADQFQLVIDRHGNVIYIHPKTKKRCVMSSEYIVSTQEAIHLFPPTLACALGLYVGRKIAHRKTVRLEHTERHLTLVKNI